MMFWREAYGRESRLAIEVSPPPLFVTGFYSFFFCAATPQDKAGLSLPRKPCRAPPKRSRVASSVCLMNPNAFNSNLHPQSCPLDPLVAAVHVEWCGGDAWVGLFHPRRRLGASPAPIPPSNILVVMAHAAHRGRHSIAWPPCLRACARRQYFVCPPGTPLYFIFPFLFPFFQEDGIAQRARSAVAPAPAWIYYPAMQSRAAPYSAHGV